MTLWRETVRDIYDRLHLEAGGVFSPHPGLALELVALIEQRHPDYFGQRNTRNEEATMVTKASGSQSTKTTPTQGQNKPQAGGAAGAGKARGGAALPSTAKTTTAQGGRKGK
jgi:hypothetical protein